MRLVVAVVTYRRPVELGRLLPALVAQIASVPQAVDLLIVDNDPAAGAREQVGATPAARYVHEPRPGIAAARNRALDEAVPADALVFVDDDEEPTPGWLAALVATWQETGAAAVAGPVEAVFDTPPDVWIVASERFARRRRPSGSELPSAASNNLLLDLAAVRRSAARFDTAFGLTGGEDTTFTRDLVRGGGRIVWCDEAVVREHVPSSRLTRSWVLRREFRSGTSWSAMALREAGDTRTTTRLGLLGRGVVRAAGGGLRWLRGVMTGDVAHRARGACLAAANAGLVAGALGQRYREYRR